jgi:predicted transcriptional regulator
MSIDLNPAIIREQLQLQNGMLEQREEVRAQIEAGFAEAERGELIPGEIAIEDLRRRRTELLRGR